MHTVPPPAVRTADHPGPNVTPLFTALLEYWAARRGLPPDPWLP